MLYYRRKLHKSVIMVSTDARDTPPSVSASPGGEHSVSLRFHPGTFHLHRNFTQFSPMTCVTYVTYASKSDRPSFSPGPWLLCPNLSADFWGWSPGHLVTRSTCLRHQSRGPFLVWQLPVLQLIRANSIPKAIPVSKNFWNQRSMKDMKGTPFAWKLRQSLTFFLPLSFSRFIPLFPAILSNSILDWEALPHWAGLERHAIVATDKIATIMPQLTDSDWRWSFQMFRGQLQFFVSLLGVQTLNLNQSLLLLSCTSRENRRHSSFPGNVSSPR